MANLTGVNVPMAVVPFTDLDTYPTFDANHGRGGWHNVADAAGRDAIPAERREVGMAARTGSDGKVWVLSGGVSNADWVELATGGGAQGPKGDKGDKGKSAYELAVDGGFAGTEPEWLDGLKGDQGIPGEPGGDAPPQITFTDLSPDDPLFPMPQSPGEVTMTTAGQPPVGGAPGQDGGMGPMGPVPSPSGSVQMVLPGDPPEFDVSVSDDPVGGLGWRFDLKIPYPDIQGALPGGGGLPPNCAVISDDADFLAFKDVDGVHMLAYGRIELDDDMGINAERVVIDGGGTGHIHNPGGMMQLYTRDASLRGVRITYWSLNMGGMCMMFENCVFDGPAPMLGQYWDEAAGAMTYASFRFVNCVFKAGMDIDTGYYGVPAGVSYVLVQGCVFGGALTCADPHPGILLVGNIENADMAAWGL